MRRVSCVEYDAELVDERLVFTEKRRWTEPADVWTSDWQRRRAPLIFPPLALVKRLIESHQKSESRTELAQENYA